MVPPEIQCAANLGLVGLSPESDGHSCDSATVAPKLFYSKVHVKNHCGSMHLYYQISFSFSFLFFYDSELIRSHGTSSNCYDS
jgi:hypothetical protein